LNDRNTKKVYSGYENVLMRKQPTSTHAEHVFPDALGNAWCFVHI